MTAVNFNLPTSSAVSEAGGLVPPGWVAPWAQLGSAQRTDQGVLQSSVSFGPRGTLITVRYPNAADAAPDQLENGIVAMYRLIRSSLESSPHRWPVRLWNHLPHIHQRMDDHRDRYMVFNGGRYKSYCQWWGGPAGIPEHVPTASGLGHVGRDLVVHCLGADRPGVAVENPRQIPAFGYSKRYGPLPPCFSRATLLNLEDQAPMLLLGGTASIVGEQSMHLGELEAQTSETLVNMAAVVQTAARRLGLTEPNESAALGAFTSLRVYYPVAAVRDWIQKRLQERFSGVTQIEYAQADLCRPELLIEIEGVARVGSAGAPTEA
jgi:enamine deaminase RidA (YjgF/YER057c/UK114 family)